MKNFSLLLLFIAGFVIGVVPVARAAEPWETAAITAITSMNKGDGKTFAENAHTDFKNLMRNYTIQKLRANPASSETQKLLKDYGVPSLDDLEKIPLDDFVRITVRFMRRALPPDVRSNMEKAQFKAVASELHGDTYTVTIEAAFIRDGQPGATRLVEFSKREGAKWKYYGNPNLIALYSKKP